MRPTRCHIRKVLLLLLLVVATTLQSASPAAAGATAGWATTTTSIRMSYDVAANLASPPVENHSRSRAVDGHVAVASTHFIASSSGLDAPGVPVGGALDDASQAAFRAADNIDDFTVPLKHQPWASGNYARFAEGVDQQGLITQALRSEGAMFLPNNRPGSFRVVRDFGQAIGTRGETALRVVVGSHGRIWTAFPVKP